MHRSRRSKIRHHMNTGHIGPMRTGSQTRVKRRVRKIASAIFSASKARCAVPACAGSKAPAGRSSSASPHSSRRVRNPNRAAKARRRRCGTSVQMVRKVRKDAARVFTEIAVREWRKMVSSECTGNTAG